MPLIEALADDELSPELLELLALFRGPLGVIPSSVRTMARVPELAAAFTALNKAVMAERTRVTPEFKRLLGYVSSFASGCLYCQAHMILASERFGASEARLNDVFAFEESPHFTEAEKAALEFARAGTVVPNGVTEAHWQRLRAHWTPVEITEITGVVSLFGFLNRWNDSMGSSLEDLPSAAGDKRLSATGWRRGKHGPPAAG